MLLGVLSMVAANLDMVKTNLHTGSRIRAALEGYRSESQMHRGHGPWGSLFCEAQSLPCHNDRPFCGEGNMNGKGK